MSRGLLTMNQREVERISIIEQVTRKQLKQSQAGKWLRVSPRQIRRMVSAYRREGAAGLISKRRGRPSNHQHVEADKVRALQLVQMHYADFGPTLAAEKLWEQHALRVSKETLRQWMIAQGLWEEKRRKKAKVHQINHLAVSAERQTQFERAMQELSIELIHADSPQAKGRVERANGTLQDRLVKEMRLRGIHTPEAANAFLPTFMADHNRRFAVTLRSPLNAHRRELPSEAILDALFSVQDTRMLSKNLELSYHGTLYQVKTAGVGCRLRHAKVTVCEDVQGHVTLWYQGRNLPYTRYEKAYRANETVNAKQVSARVDQVIQLTKPTVPASEHPWRRYVVKPANAVIPPGFERSSYPQGSQGV